MYISRYTVVIHTWTRHALSSCYLKNVVVSNSCSKKQFLNNVFVWLSVLWICCTVLGAVTAKGDGSGGEDSTISPPECSFLISYSLFPCPVFLLSSMLHCPQSSRALWQVWCNLHANVFQIKASLQRSILSFLCPFAHLVFLLACLLVYTRDSLSPTYPWRNL